MKTTRCAASATTKVVMAGPISSHSERTMTIETMTAQSENSAMRRAQMASREIDCSLKTRRRIVADWLMPTQRSP